MLPNISNWMTTPYREERCCVGIILCRDSLEQSHLLDLCKLACLCSHHFPDWLTGMFHQQPLLIWSSESFSKCRHLSRSPSLFPTCGLVRNSIISFYSLVPQSPVVFSRVLVTVAVHLLPCKTLSFCLCVQLVQGSDLGSSARNTAGVLHWKYLSWNPSLLCISYLPCGNTFHVSVARTLLIIFPKHF